MAKKKEALANAQKLGIGVGLTAAAVAAAGAYFLYGSKDAAKNRKKVKSWTLKAKAEVLEALENAKEISEAEFQALVTGVTETYSKVHKLSKAEAKDFKNEMMGSWKDLMASGTVNVLQAKQVLDKVTKKSKKVAKKAPAKKAPAKQAQVKKKVAKKKA
jgi:outer membrane biosynthesis protein TonB